MPFTPSHTVAVFPLLKSEWFSATGLVIGSMAPDFEYFLRMSVLSEYSHTLAGILYFDLPITFSMAIIFHLVVKNNLISNLPAFLQRRLQDLKDIPFLTLLRNRPLGFIASAIVGSATHIAWDGFTHADGFFVTHLPFVYEGRTFLVDGAHYPLWYLMQHISTFVGLIILVSYIWMLPSSGKTVTKVSWTYWFGLIFIASSILVIRLQFHIDREEFGTTIISGITGCCIAVILLGFIPFKGNKV